MDDEDLMERKRKENGIRNMFKSAANLTVTNVTSVVQGLPNV